MHIRPFEDNDWPQVWTILEPIFRAGETYVFSPELTEEQAHHLWVETPEATFVASLDYGAEEILGTYYLKPNFPGLGNHICNCGYAVGHAAQGRGVASTMCLHSLDQGRSRGYRAMQFNYVVSTNEQAVRLWQKHGFNLIGTIPKAFRHRRFGEVDAYIMHRFL